MLLHGGAGKCVVRGTRACVSLDTRRGGGSEHGGGAPQMAPLKHNWNWKCGLARLARASPAWTSLRLAVGGEPPTKGRRGRCRALVLSLAAGWGGRRRAGWRWLPWRRPLRRPRGAMAPLRRPLRRPAPRDEMNMSWDTGLVQPMWDSGLVQQMWGPGHFHTSLDSGGVHTW